MYEAIVLVILLHDPTLDYIGGCGRCGKRKARNHRRAHVQCKALVRKATVLAKILGVVVSRELRTSTACGSCYCGAVGKE